MYGALNIVIVIVLAVVVVVVDEHERDIMQLSSRLISKMANLKLYILHIP